MNLFDNILNKNSFLSNQPSPSFVPKTSVVQPTQKMTLFSDEQQMFQKMKADNLTDEQSYNLLKKRRADILGGNDLGNDEKEMLLKMQADNVPVKQAVAMIKKRREDQFNKKYEEGNLLQKGAYNALSFAAGNLETIAKYSGNTLDFITGGTVGFGDEVKKMEQVTQSPEFDSTAFKAGKYLPDVALAVSPIGGGYMAGAKGMTGLQGANLFSKLGAKNLTQGLMGRSAVVGAGFGATQPILEQGSDVSMGDIAIGAGVGALGGAIAAPVFGKAFKYGKAGYYGGLTGAGKSIARDVKGGLQAITPSGANISTRANRFNALDEQKFIQATKQTPGEFATSRGMTKVGDDAVEEATKLWQASKDQADEAFQAIEGKFRIGGNKDFIIGAIEGLQGKLSKYSPEIERVNELATKYQTEGLTMSEVNELKRLYASNHKYSFLDSGSKQAIESRDIQDGLRKWQFKVAEENGLPNIADINKNTQAWKMYADSLAKKQNRSVANNANSLTDWIVLGGGSPENIALYLGKKLASSDRVKQGAIKLFSKQTKPSIIKANKADIQRANFQKNVNRGISNPGDNSGGNSMVRVAGLLPAPSGKATGAKNFRVNQPKEAPIMKEKVNNSKRPGTTSKGEPNIVKELADKKTKEVFLNRFKSDLATNTQSARYGGTGNTRIESAINAAIEKKQITRQEAIDIVMDIMDELSSGKKKRFLYMDEKALEKYANELFSNEPTVIKPKSGTTISSPNKKVIGLTDETANAYKGETGGGIKNVEPGKQVKYNQGDSYEPVRMALTQKDADIARFGALSKKQMKSSISENEKREMAGIKGRLKMSNAELETRAQELRDIAKLARSNKESILVDLRNGELPEGYTKNAFGEIIKKPSQKNGGFIKLPTKPSIKRSPDIEGVPNGLIEEARKYKDPKKFISDTEKEFNGLLKKEFPDEDLTVSEIYIVGSTARGKINPNDIDVAMRIKDNKTGKYLETMMDFPVKTKRAKDALDVNTRLEDYLSKKFTGGGRPAEALLYGLQKDRPHITLEQFWKNINK